MRNSIIITSVIFIISAVWIMLIDGWHWGLPFILVCGSILIFLWFTEPKEGVKNSDRTSVSGKRDDNGE